MTEGTKLIFLHGRPAVGKLTIARSIASVTGAVVIDNHTLIDCAKVVFDFGSPEFFELVRATRILLLEHVVAACVPVEVVTTCYSDPHDRVQLETIERTVLAGGGTVLPAYLTCTVDAQHMRVGREDRVLRKKVTTVDGLEEFQRKFNFCPVPRPTCETFDTTESSPQETAAAILGRFGVAYSGSSFGP